MAKTFKSLKDHEQTHFWRKIAFPLLVRMMSCRVAIPADFLNFCLSKHSVIAAFLGMYLLKSAKICNIEHFHPDNEHSAQHASHLFLMIVSIMVGKVFIHFPLYLV